MPSSHFIWRIVGDEGFLLDLGSGHFYSFNAVGAETWDALNAGLGVDAICERVQNKFAGADPEVVRADVLELIDELRREQLWS